MLAYELSQSPNQNWLSLATLRMENVILYSVLFVSLVICISMTLAFLLL